MGFKKTDSPLYLGANRTNFSNARMLRRTSTKAEQLLWNKLRNKKLRRTYTLENQGITIIRFNNIEIIENIENTLTQIVKYLEYLSLK